eukprot:scaffold94734_cov45-Phaeocystis_antarctica.AAC.1
MNDGERAEVRPVRKALVWRHVEKQGLRGRPASMRGPRGRSSGQPGSSSGAERSLRRASWPKAEPPCFRQLTPTPTLPLTLTLTLTRCGGARRSACRLSRSRGGRGSCRAAGAAGSAASSAV